MVDQIPYAPRIDLWHLKNSAQGTLPPDLAGLSADELARSQGWGLHKIILEYQEHGQKAIIDRCLGIYNLPQQGYYYELPKEIERKVSREGDELVVTYHTPKGDVKGAWQFNEETLFMGITIPWIKKHVVKDAKECAAAAYIFANLNVIPCPQDFSQWFSSYQEDALEVAYALTAGGPMHHILKVLCSPEVFYLLLNDHPRAVEELAEGIDRFYQKALRAACECKSPVILVGANFDDTITYPAFFKKYMLPWLNQAADYLHGHGKLMLCHTDGENRGLMDYLANCGMDVAEALCPSPMTKETLQTYYEHWSEKITIFGGIPSSILMPESFSEEMFDAYVKNIFATLTPGVRLILGVADTTPPQAPIERLQRIGELARQLGKLPLKGKVTAIRPATKTEAADQTVATEDVREAEEPFVQVRELLLKGDEQGLHGLCRHFLAGGMAAQDILEQGLLGAMEIISQRFKDNTVFIPEVLLSARAMNSVVNNVLGPDLAKISIRAKGRILLGTVKGDLHDIGKNLVSTMLKGCGFEVVDLGTDVPAAKFVEAIKEHQPNLVGLSALLTTTMPQMKETIEVIGKAGLRGRIRIIVGGAPVTQEFARNIGADAYCENAGDAIPTAEAFLDELRK